MELRPVPAQGRQVIQAYRTGGFTISGQRHTGSVVVRLQATVAWPVERVESLDLASFSALVDDRGALDIVLVGTGSIFRPLPAGLAGELARAGLKVEAMATPAACRTYNVLAGEARRVAAALIAPEA